MAFICINNGYANTKVKFKNREFMFKSATREAAYEYDTDIVDVNGKRLVVGEGEVDVDLNKTSSETQIACIKHALNLSGLREANVITAMPVNSYLNKTAREEYKLMFKQSGIVNEVIVYMEGMAAVLSDYAWYKNKLVCLLDIGGLTINAMLVDNGNLVDGTAFSMQLGTIILDNRIRKALEQNSLCNVPSYQIKYLTNSHEAMNVLREYVKEIKQNLKKANYPTSIEYRLTGGGSLQYQVFLKAQFNAYLSQDAIWENVRGLSIVGGMLYEKDSLH